MRIIIPVLSALALAACAPTVPNSGPDGQYSSNSVPDTTNRPRGDAPAGIAIVHSELEFATPGMGTPDTQLPPLDSPNSLSNEQSFKAVTARVTIAQDKARLEEMRREYKIIPPEPLPERPRSDGPNLAAYALSTHNSVGQKIYKRLNIFGKGAYDRACARYTSPDRAQEAFLRNGGPQHDPLGLDPDGDGFACAWDPAPFRKGISAARAREDGHAGAAPGKG